MIGSTLVTTGPLNQGEQQAVCHHEAVHVRLGHPRLLPLWPSCDAHSRPQADDEMVKACRTRPLLCAPAKVALAGAPAASLAFAGAEDIRYRIERIKAPKRATHTSSAAFGILAVVLTPAMGRVACTAPQGAAP